MKRPNLFILGAPKCGTTSLVGWLRQHPQVFLSRAKEPHHFYSPYGAPMPRDAYEALFEEAGERHAWVGEASVWYLFSETAVEAIERYSPGARYVVCLRDPVEMAPSLHAQKRYTGHETIASFAEAWRLGERRERGEHVGVFGIPDGDPSHLSYRKACRIGSQLDALFARVDPARVHLLWLDEMSSSPATAWAGLLDFLGLPAVGDIEFRRANAATDRPSPRLHRMLMRLRKLREAMGLERGSGAFAWLHRLNSRQRRYDAPEGDLSRELADAFADERRKLEAYRRRDGERRERNAPGTSP